MYKRPNPEETDEDLLAQQEEFLKNLKDKKVDLAAKVIPHKTSSDSESAVQSVKGIDNDVQEHLENTFESIPTNINIGRIVEKRKLIEDGCVSLTAFNKSTGFPKAKRRDVTVPSRSGSIFSQQMKKTKPKEIFTEEMDCNDQVTNKISLNLGNIIKESKILSESDKDNIHESNLNLLNTTPESEILEERERLLSTMDPAILSYLKAKRREQIPKSTNPSIHQQNKAGENVTIEQIKVASDILENPDSEKWLNFNLLETHKLAWMKEMEVIKIDKNKAFEARFDFDGWLLPFQESNINEKNRVLFHHGEEPERPGYTLQELFTLARSSVTQQKIIALNSIANILHLHSTGIYQDVIEIPIEQIFFLIRFCLDDNTLSVLNACTKAMRSLISNDIDEICLDCLLGFGGGDYLPIVPVDHELKDDNTVNDQQLAEINIIRCLVRTGIFTRIRYIINTVKPPLETIVYCLEILIRLAKDSDFVFNEMHNTENLISSIVAQFVPSTYQLDNQGSAYGTPILQALKFVRVCCSRNKKIAEDFVIRYGIIDRISKYLQDEIFGMNTNGMKLQLECFHLWRVFLGYELTLNDTSILESILLRHLVYHFTHTNVVPDVTYVRESHCSGMLILLGKLLSIRPSCRAKFETLLEDCISKWCQQFQRLEKLECGKSQIISSVFFMCTMTTGYSKLSERSTQCISNLMKSKAFSNFTLNSIKCSMLLNNYEPQTTSPNLRTLQTSAWYTADHVIPIMQNTSCLPFLHSLSEFVVKSGTYSMKLSFLSHENINNYIQLLEKRKTHFLTNHWFTRIETNLLMNILQISVDVQKDLDTSIFYSLAIKSLCVFNQQQKEGVEYVLENIVFCPSFYPPEVLLKNLELAERNENLELSLSNLGEIRTVYSEVLGLKVLNKVESSFVVDMGLGNMIPVDWIYTPIIVLYSNQQQKTNPLSEEQQIRLVKNCLRWILIYETYFPHLAAAVNPTDRFCRLACVLLGSDCLFLNNEIHNLLEACLNNILQKHEDKLDFDKPVEGLNNFQDFLNQLLEQYQGVSYGDILFSNFVMVPISQKQNVQWRKTLWSEYSGVVQILNLSKEKMLSSLDTYLQPLEEDESLLKCYKNILSRGLVRKTSILHLIASHHYKEFIKRKQT